MNNGQPWAETGVVWAVFCDFGVVLFKLQVGQVEQEKQLDNIQGDVDWVIGWRLRRCAVDDGQRAGVHHSVEQDGLCCQHQASQDSNSTSKL